jgi:hypothetical protein
MLQLHARVAAQGTWQTRVCQCQSNGESSVLESEDRPYPIKFRV